MSNARIWRDLGSEHLSDLIEERLQLHWAAQALSAATHAVLDRQPGDHHTNLGWDPDADAFVTHPFNAGHRASLAVAAFELRWLAPDGTILESFPLEGQTLETARLWITDLARPVADGLPEGPVPLRDYDMPTHPVENGQPFSGGDPAKRAELANWYANADLALAEIATDPAGSDVRTWPHHFDIGLLIALEPDKDPEEARSIGVGMSPGDTTIPQPYYYVYPYPRPQDAPLPELPSGGRWEQEAFFGAVLTGDVLADGGEVGEQHDRVGRFLDSAIKSARVLLHE